MRKFIYSLIISLCCLTSTAFAQSRNLIVVVNSDTHFGATDSIQNNRGAIQAINGIAGTPYSPHIGGIVGTPSGVVVCGDLTDHSLSGEWDDFTDHYPLNGGTGVNEIHYPVKELRGNHDHKEPWYYFGDTPVSDGVRDRQGELNHTWTWDGVFFASLDVHPTVDSSGWLANDLDALAPQTPVVLFSHYGYRDWNRGDWDDWNNESAAFLNAIAGHNVIALVHGHGHGHERYAWEGYDVYTTGSPKTTATQSFGVMNIQDNKFIWSERKYLLDGDGNLTGGYWAADHEKTIVPEPTGLLIMGITGLGLLRRRRMRLAE